MNFIRVNDRRVFSGIDLAEYFLMPIEVFNGLMDYYKEHFDKDFAYRKKDNWMLYKSGVYLLLFLLGDLLDEERVKELIRELEEF